MGLYRTPALAEDARKELIANGYEEVSQVLISASSTGRGSRRAPRRSPVRSKTWLAPCHRESSDRWGAADRFDDGQRQPGEQALDGQGNIAGANYDEVYQPAITMLKRRTTMSLIWSRDPRSKR